MFPSSNGHAEVNVRILKSLVAKTGCKSIAEEKFMHGLLELRNSPRADGRSPSQVVFGHPMRSQVPMHHSSYAKEWQRSSDEADRKAAEQEMKMIERYDRSTRRLKPLKPGTIVLIQDPLSKRWTKSGSIVSCGKNRDYRVVTASGRVYWRNRRFLRPKILPNAATPDPEKNDEPEKQPDVPLRRSERERKPVVRFRV